MFSFLSPAVYRKGIGMSSVELCSCVCQGYVCLTSGRTQNKPSRDVAGRLEARAAQQSQRSRPGMLDTPFSTAQVAICVRE